jgi:hypothetical protein
VKPGGTVKNPIESTSPENDGVSAAVHRIALRHCSSLARLQMFAEVARVGFEHSLLASKVDPDKQLNQQLAGYVLSQNNEFYDLFQNITVRLWATLEAFVSDVCLLVLKRVDWKSPPPKWPKMRVDAIELLRTSEDELAEFLLLKLDDAIAAPLKPGVGRFEGVLDSLGFGGPVPDRVKRELLCLSAYRNCIVHRDGLIDRRLAERLPEFASVIGQRLAPTAMEARAFLYACFWYIFEVDRRFRASEGADHSSVASEQGKFLARLDHDPTAPSAIPFARANLEFAKGVPIGSKIVVLGPPENSATSAAAKNKG